MSKLSALASLTSAVRRTLAPQVQGGAPAPSPGAGVTGNVILTNLAGPVVAAVPVTTGIPFPDETVFNVSQLRLEDVTTAAETAAQFDILATWPSGAIKSAQLNYVANVGAADTTQRLHYGPGVSRSVPGVSASASQSGGVTTVTAGPITAAINAKGNITHISRDGQIIVGPQDLYMVRVDDVEFTASNATDTVVTIEENGPIRVVVKARGTHRSSGGSNFIQYVARYYFHAGSDAVDVEVTRVDEVVEEVLPGDGSPPALLPVSCKSVGMRGAVTLDGTTQYRFGGESNAMYSGNVTGEHYLYQGGAWNFIGGNETGNVFNYSGVGTGTYAPGFVSLNGSTGTRRLGIFIKDFWQQYPGEININNGTIDLKFWSGRGITTFDTSMPPQVNGTAYARPNSYYHGRTGGAKTYRVRFSLHGTVKSNADLHAENTLYQRNTLECMAPQAWYLNSKVWGELISVPSSGPVGGIAWFMQAVVTPSITNLANPQAGGLATCFGWRDYGDRLRAGWDNVINGVPIPTFYNGAHIGGGRWIELFLMTGERRLWDLAYIESMHFMDLDVHHSPRRGYWGNNVTPQPAGEIYQTGHSTADHENRNAFEGHLQWSAMGDIYLLTGDKRSYDVFLECAGWERHFDRQWNNLPFNWDSHGRECERDFAYPLHVMTQAVRVTNDWTYHRDVSAHLVTYLRQWIDWPKGHYGYNPATGTYVSNTNNDFTTTAPININNGANGTGFWTMHRSDNSGVANGGNYTGTNPWMALPCLSAICLFLDQEKQYLAAGFAPTVNMTSIIDMLFQVLNYVVKYGYVNDTIGFAYCENQRAYNGDGQALAVFPLLYINKLYNEEFAAGRVANPQWYDTRSQWAHIAEVWSNTFINKNGYADSQSYGFYGYEIPFPNQFWAYAKQAGLIA